MQVSFVNVAPDNWAVKSQVFRLHTFLLFQFMHCFEGHHVTTLGEIYSKQGTRQQIQEVDSINNFVQKGKLKATEIQDNMKNLESSLGRLSEHYSKTQRDIKEAFKVIP
jgi:hypothetical protein